MSEQDGIVQVSNKNIDNSEVTRPDGTVVERQRVVQADGITREAATVTVSGDSGRGMTLGEQHIAALLSSIHERLEEIVMLLEHSGG